MMAAQVPGQVVVAAGLLALVYLVGQAVALVFSIVAAIVAWWRGRRHDVGPDALRLLEDLHKHLDRCAARDPEVAAGFARLDAAIQDRQRGEAS
ncbi:hypothetical protein ACWCQN_13110 [Streptomyces sp. NPDC001984]